MVDVTRGTLTFLFTDVDLGSRLPDADPEQAKQAILRHDALLNQAMRTHGGRVFKRIGNSFQVAFPTAAAALAAAAAAQHALHAEYCGPGGFMRVRMALHSGVAEERNGEYVGPLFNRLARTLAAAHGGQVLLTEATQALLRETLPEGLDVRDMGEHRLRDLVRPEHVFQMVTADLPQDFPPLKTLTDHPNNLPLQPTPLIGREQEMEDCLALLRRPEMRLLTLTGAAGTGKTRLGLQLAAELIDDFTDGVFYAGLASISDPTLVPPAIAQALGLHEGGGQPLEDALAGYLHERQMLLLLDNFEQVLDSAPLLTRLLQAAPLLKVLVTSRAALRLMAEQEYRVPPLDLPDLKHLPQPAELCKYASVELFITRAQALLPMFALDDSNAAAIAEICVRLDGLPLAIELAAARIKIMAPEAIAARLNRRLGLLTGGGRDLPARHQTLRSAVDWSYGLLNEGERKLFRRLAVFSGGFALEAVEAVCRPGAELGIDGLDGVASLVDKSLLYQRELPGGDVRFWMLETIQEYATEQLVKSGEAEEMHRRQAAFFSELAEDAERRLAGPEKGAWLERLEREHGNFRAALGWATERGEEATVLRLAALASFWELRGYLSEGRHWLEAALAAADTSAATNDLAAARARTLDHAGGVAYLQGDLAAARARLEESAALWRAVGDKRGLAHALFSLSIVATQQGERDLARDSAHESLALYRSSNDVWGVAMATNSLGQLALQEGDYARARQFYAESLDLWQQLPDKGAYMWIFRDLVLMALLQGDHGLARSLYEEGLATYQSLDRRQDLNTALWVLARVAYLLGDCEQAEALFTQRLDGARQQGDREGVAWLTNQLGDVARRMGDDAKAEARYKEAWALFEKIGHRQGLAAVHHNLGYLAEHRGDEESAASLFGEALRVFWELGHRWSTADALVGVAGVQAMGRAHGGKRAELAARLLAAADAAHRAVDTSGALVDPANRGEWERVLTGVRQLLPEPGFTTAWQQGSALTLQEAVEVAEDSLAHTIRQQTASQ